MGLGHHAGLIVILALQSSVLLVYTRRQIPESLIASLQELSEFSDSDNGTKRTDLCVIKGPAGGPDFRVELGMDVSSSQSCEILCTGRLHHLFKGPESIDSMLQTRFEQGRCLCSAIGGDPVWVVYGADTTSCPTEKVRKKCWDSLQHLINYGVDAKKKIDYGNIGSFRIETCAPCEQHCEDKVTGLQDLVKIKARKRLQDLQTQDSTQAKRGRNGLARALPLEIAAEVGMGAMELKQVSVVKPARATAPKTVSSDVLQDGMDPEAVKTQKSEPSTEWYKVVVRDATRGGQPQASKVAAPPATPHRPSGKQPQSSPVPPCGDGVFPASCMITYEPIGSPHFTGGKVWHDSLSKDCTGNTLLIQLDPREHPERVIALRFNNLDSKGSMRDSTLLPGSGRVPLKDAFRLREGMLFNRDHDIVPIAMLDDSVRSTDTGDNLDMQLTLIGGDPNSDGLQTLDLTRTQELIMYNRLGGPHAGPGVLWARVGLDKEEEVEQPHEYLGWMGMTEVVKTKTKIILRAPESGYHFIKYLPSSAVQVCNASES